MNRQQDNIYINHPIKSERQVEGYSYDSGKVGGGSQAEVSCQNKSKGNRRRLLFATILIGMFSIIELVGGIFANSLALLADAAHMFVDFISMFLSWFAYKYSAKEPDVKRTFGYQRIQVLAAFGNSIMLFTVLFFILYEAIMRILNPEVVEWQIMLQVAIIGIVSNIVVFFILNGCIDKNLNLRGAILHVLGDLLGFVGAFFAAIIIGYSNWLLADPLLSIVMSFIIFFLAIRLVRQSGHILLEGTPSEFSYESLEKNLLENIPNILNVHHFHAWSLSEDYTVVTMHIVIKQNVSAFNTVVAIKHYLKKSMNIMHATIEVEYEEDKCSDAIVGMD